LTSSHVTYNVVVISNCNIGMFILPTGNINDNFLCATAHSQNA
jgi:hypothetical protein